MPSETYVAALGSYRIGFGTGLTVGAVVTALWGHPAAAASWVMAGAFIITGVLKIRSYRRSRQVAA